MSDARAIRIFGDSHCATIGRAWLADRGSAPFDRINSVNMLAAATAFYEPFYRIETDRIRMTAPLFEGRMRGLCDENGFLIEDGSDLLISLGLHTNTFLNSRLFYQHMPHFCAPEKSHAFISTAAIASITRHYHRHVLAFCDELSQRGQSFAILSAPPPTRRFGLLQRGFSSSSVIRLDQIVRATMIEEFSQRGIQVVQPSAHFTDAEGFLLEKYLIEDEADPHHGNLDYSREFLAQIMQGADRHPVVAAAF